MATERGWYPDPNNKHSMRFWTGTQWMGERTWNGVAWVEQTEPAADSAPTAGAVGAPLSRAISSIATSAWLVFGGVAVAALGSLLPWVQGTGTFGNTVSASPQGGGSAFLISLCAIVAWVAWPVRLGNLSMPRRVGVTVLSGLLTIFVFSNFADLGNLQRQNPTANISGGPGLYLYTVGVVALWIGVVRTWTARRRVAETSVNEMR